MKKNCLYLAAILIKKDKVVDFERDTRTVLLAILPCCRSISFAHTLSEASDVFKLVKNDKKLGRILFNGYSKDKRNEIIAYIEKKMPGNEFEYGIHSEKGEFENIDKSVFSTKEKVLTEEPVEA